MCLGEMDRTGTMILFLLATHMKVSIKFHSQCVVQTAMIKPKVSLKELLKSKKEIKCHHGTHGIRIHCLFASTGEMHMRFNTHMLGQTVLITERMHSVKYMVHLMKNKKEIKCQHGTHGIQIHCLFANTGEMHMKLNIHMLVPTVLKAESNMKN